MAVIRIQDRPGRPDGSNAVLSFDHGPEYLITISDPFTEKEEQELAWYFEEHLRFPFYPQCATCGELSVVPVAAAIANAIRDAVGCV